jgi:hypothetical protein
LLFSPITLDRLQGFFAERLVVMKYFPWEASKLSQKGHGSGTAEISACSRLQLIRLWLKWAFSGKSSFNHTLRAGVFCRCIKMCSLVYASTILIQSLSVWLAVCCFRSRESRATLCV